MRRTFIGTVILAGLAAACGSAVTSRPAEDVKDGCEDPKWQQSASIGPPTPGTAGLDADSESDRAHAAMVCFCRANRHRGIAITRQEEATALTIVGGVATVGGGALNGVAATEDGTTKKTLAETGIVTLGVGAAAFGLYTALNSGARPAVHESVAADQERAGRILRQKGLQSSDYAAAWETCAAREGAHMELNNQAPSAAFNPAARSGGDASDGGPGAASDSGDPAAASSGGTGPATEPAKKKDAGGVK